MRIMGDDVIEDILPGIFKINPTRGVKIGHWNIPIIADVKES
jgi:hypothetical protein